MADDAPDFAAQVFGAEPAEPTPVPAPAAPPAASFIPAAPMADAADVERVRADVARFADLNAQLAQPLHAAPAPTADFWIEPERAIAEMQAATAREMESTRADLERTQIEWRLSRISQALNASERQARAKHGDSAVDAAVHAALQAGTHLSFVQQPDAYAELMRWHGTQALMHEMAGDPAAYRARVRQQLLAEMAPQQQSRGRVPLVAADGQVQSTREFLRGMFSSGGR
jgi:hypothetical protein